MYNLLLFAHFASLAISAGTGVYIAAVSAHAGSNLEQSEARTLMPGIVGAISRVGMIGLVVLVGSGIAMAAMNGNAIVTKLFILKLLLVSAIIIFVFYMNRLSARMGKGDKSAVMLAKRLGPIGPLLAVLTIGTSVAVFG